VHTIAWVLVGVAAYDGAGLLYGGNDFASSPTFAVLSSIPGGMRTWGVLLLIGAVAVAWGIGRDSSGHPRALNLVLAGGVAYYLFWTAVIPLTWIQLGHIPAWGALSKPAALAVLYFACARAVAPRSRSWVDRMLHRALPARSHRGQE
jgi:hypothetical protein